jgi:hypothetical protein
VSDDNSANPKANPAAQGDAGSPPAALPVLEYATPSQFQVGLRREGRYVVVPHGIDLPDQCIKCGKPADTRFPVALYHMAELRQTKIHVGLCRHHALQGRIVSTVAKSLWALASIPFWYDLLFRWYFYWRRPWIDNPPKLTVAILLVVISAVLFLKPMRPVWRQHSNARFVWLGGAKEPFLKDLPTIHPAESSVFTRDLL